MSKHGSDFEFAGWLAETWPRRSFSDCLRRAADHLSFGRDRLPRRVCTALVSFFFCDQEEIPPDMKADFAKIFQDVRRRGGGASDDINLLHIDVGKLDRSLRRCSPRTAERIARKIVEWDRKITLGKALGANTDKEGPT